MVKWFGTKTDPIGVDLGRSSVKLAQVNSSGGQSRLTAAMTIEVPEALRNSSTGPQELLRSAVMPALDRNGFRGRRVVLGMPASWVHIDRLRLAPSLTPEQVRQTVAWESIDRLPFHPSRAMLRHLVAGDVYENQELKSEVIVLAARNELTESLLDAARRAKLDVIGLLPEPLALIGGFAAAGASGGVAASSAEMPVRAVIDIGHGGTRFYVAHGERIQFARSIGIGWSHLGAPATSRTAADDETLHAASGGSGRETAVLEQRASAATAIATEPLRRLVGELSISRHYHAQTFHNTPIGEVIVVGGVAGHPRLRAQLSAVLNLPVRGGDPLAPYGPSANAKSGGLASRPEWAVAIGLSLSHAA